MLELKNLGVVEMSSQEIVDVEGGLAPIVWGIILVICLLSSQKAY